MKKLIRTVLTAALISLSMPFAQSLAQDKGGAQQPANVIVATTQKQKLADSVEALGTLRANETVTLMATVTETVTAVNFTDGQRVQKGQVLVEMASGEEKAQLDQARALAAEAGQQLERVRVLDKQNAIAQSTIDERKRDYDSAQGKLREVESRLKDYLISAPFGGVLGLRNISIGALLQPGSKITTLDDDSVMKLDFSVPSIFLKDLKTGVPVVARAREFGDRQFQGQVESLDSQIDPVTRSITVRAILPNESHILKPGLLMSVLLFSNPRDSILIPEGALMPEGQDNYVLTVNSRQTPPVLEKRKVVIGTRQPGKVEIVSGLQEGETFVTQGTMTARPGQAVNILGQEKDGQSLEDILAKADAKSDQSKDADKKDKK